jgi:ADP-ribose pyrophosphatase YjhB (NUDIX family)
MIKALKNKSEKMSKKNWLPEKEFHEILGKMPIPCIDLIINTHGNLLLVRRNIEPYKDLWALPGGRILHGETFAQAIKRIGKNEIGIDIPIKSVVRLSGAYTAMFPKFYDRHDVGLCFYVRLDNPKVHIDNHHYSEFNWWMPITDFPEEMGHIYKEELRDYMKKEGETNG